MKIVTLISTKLGRNPRTFFNLLELKACWENNPPFVKQQFWYNTAPCWTNSRGATTTNLMEAVQKLVQQCYFLTFKHKESSLFIAFNFKVYF